MGRFVWHRQEVVFCRGGQVENFAAGHHIVVHINRVDRVGHKDRVVLTEQVEQIAQIALCTVRYKNLRHIQRNAVVSIVAADGIAQELIALLAGNVAVEGILMALLLDRAVHCLCHRCGQRQRDIADAQTDDVSIGVGLLVVGHLVGDGAEEIALIQFCVMRIQLHDSPPLIYTFI